MTPGPVELRAPLGDRVLVVASPTILVLLGLVGLASDTGRTVGVTLIVAGAVVFVVAALTMPWYTQVDGDGIRRVALLRSRTLDWDDVVAIERHRRRGGGLLVRTMDRRRVVILTKAERPADWDRLREIVADHAPGVVVPDPPPLHPFNRRHDS